MSETKPRQFWIYKGASNFCSTFDLTDDYKFLVRQKPDGFYDIVSTRDTVQGGIHVLEAKPVLKLLREMGTVLEFYSNKTKLDCGEMASIKLEKLNTFLASVDNGEL